MVMSVNTNAGAMIALQSLTKTTNMLSTTQFRITTGLRVNGPKDDAATFAIAQNMRGDIAGMSAVKTNLSLGQSVVSVAIDAGTAIADLLTEMKAKSVPDSKLSLPDPSGRSVVVVSNPVPNMLSIAHDSNANVYGHL